MTKTTPENIDSYSSLDFEQAAQRLLGKRYHLLKALNATAAQICDAFVEAYFGGELIESDENKRDVRVMLSVSADIYVGAGQAIFIDRPPERMPSQNLSLGKLLRCDTPPDHRFLWHRRLLKS